MMKDRYAIGGHAGCWILLLIIVFLPACTVFGQEISQTTFTGRATQNHKSVLDPEDVAIDQTGTQFFSQWDYDQKANFGGYGKYKVSLQLNYDEASRSRIRSDVKELYGIYDLNDSWQVMLGRKIQDWGKSYYRSPSAILTPESRLTDLNKRQSAGLGFDTVEADYVQGDWSLSLVYVRSFQSSDTSDNLAIVRPTLLANGWDISLMFAKGSKVGNLLGGNFTKTLGDSLEIHGDILSGNKGIAFQYYGEQIAKRDVFLQASLGTFFSIDAYGKDVRWISEFYYNSLGYSKAEWKQYKTQIRDLFDAVSRPEPLGDVRASKLFKYTDTVSHFDPKTLSRLDFFTTFDKLPSPFARFSYRPIFVYSLIDQGFVGIASVDYEIKTQVWTFADYNRYGGPQGSIFQSIPRKEDMIIGIKSKF